MGYQALSLLQPSGLTNRLWYSGPRCFVASVAWSSNSKAKGKARPTSPSLPLTQFMNRRALQRTLQYSNTAKKVLHTSKFTGYTIYAGSAGRGTFCRLIFPSICWFADGSDNKCFQPTASAHRFEFYRCLPSGVFAAHPSIGIPPSKLLAEGRVHLVPVDDWKIWTLLSRMVSLHSCAPNRRREFKSFYILNDQRHWHASCKNYRTAESKLRDLCKNPLIND